ncbi:MAG: D-alanine--D-alanine ligase [Thermotogota bacterium]|nr:D-alanine--D-alanine ligase [Thermotogota bacterium]
MSNIAVVFGGFSCERGISLKSGSNVIHSLEKLGHTVKGFDLKKENVHRLSELSDNDLVFIALHGRYGEDGKIQGYLDSLDIPYTGSKVLSSAICFDKTFTYNILKEHVIFPKGTIFNKNQKSETLKWDVFPAIVKPSEEGSSIGVSIVDNKEQLFQAINKTLNSYETVIVEKFIGGRELSISIIEKNNQLLVLPILEIKPKKRFYDYEAKYTAGMTSFSVPAELGTQMEKSLIEKSKEIYERMKCRHFARIDGILKDNTFYFLEVNTIPGLTDLSDLPLSAQAEGMNFVELIDVIVQEALK